MSFFFGENQYLYKNNPFFCNLTAKVLQFIVLIYIGLNLMLHYSTYIYPVVFTYKTCQNIFFFRLEN